MAAWSPQSWQSKPIRQVPVYPDQAALDAVLAKLKSHPPLVFAGEARNLMANLALVAVTTAPDKGVTPSGATTQ